MNNDRAVGFGVGLLAGADKAKTKAELNGELRDMRQLIAQLNALETKHKRIERRLTASEVRYRRLFETAQDGILIIEAGTGEITDVNPFLSKMLGYAKGHFLGKRLWEIGFFKDIAANQQAFHELQDKGFIRYEDLPLETKDGRSMDVEFVSNVYTVDGDKVIQCNIRDITERKLTEGKIKQVHETLLVSNKKLEKRNHQNHILSEMRELLQTCSTIQEMPPIITNSASKVFPNTGGALFLLNNSRTDLQSVGRWGAFSEDVDDNIFKPDACWGLRLGRIHRVADIKIGPICPHLKHPPSAPYICLPLIAKGDILGLLHLRIEPSVSGEDSWSAFIELEEMLVLFAEYLSLSIANIKLWEKLADQSIRDPLTGLFNRRYMEETIQREILRAARKQTKIGIVMADIDHFKKFNDTQGHKAGDELLVKLADFFKLKIRGSDIACRYGGEEFILILPESSTKDTYKRAEYLRAEVKNIKVIFKDQLLPSITLSMGIATYPDHGTELNDLIRVADTALYEAKDKGRDRVISG